MTHPATPADDFDAAKAIVDKLAAVPRERQERILRWVSESLGVSGASSGGPPAPYPPAAAGTAGALTPPPTPGSGKDIKSFVAEKAPKSDNQFAAAVAYYYRFEAPPASRRATIDGSALQEAARLAGWRRPKRATDTLHNARKAGYLDTAERGTFSLNNVGENLVAMALPAGNAGVSKRKARGRKPAKKGKRKNG